MSENPPKSSAFSKHLTLALGGPRGHLWVDKDGCRHESKVEFLQSTFLKFCACGAPAENLEYICGALKLIAERRPDGVSHEEWYPGYRARVDEFYKGDSRSEYFMYYFLDKEGFIEHGTSVPGWLTEEGHELLEMLSEALEKSE